MSRSNAASAYASVGVESAVMSASPYQLIVLLFDGADRAIRVAAVHMQAGRMGPKGEAISRALDIINNGLLAALDTEQGGEMAERLASLYGYIARRLLRANFDNDKSALDEAARLLGDIGSAWRAIEPTTAGRPA